MSTTTPRLRLEEEPAPSSMTWCPATDRETSVERFLLAFLLLSVATIPFATFRLATSSFYIPLAAVPLALIAMWSVVAPDGLITTSPTTRRTIPIMVCFGAWALLSITWSVFPLPAHAVALSFYIASSAAVLGFARFNAQTLLRGSRLLLFIMTLLILRGLYLTIRGYTPWFEFAQHELTGLGTRNSDAFMIATLLPLALARFVVRGSSTPSRLLALGVSALYISAILLSLSRSSTVVPLGVLLLVLVIGRKVVPLRLRTLILTCLVLGGAALAIVHAGFTSQELSVDRFQTISTSERLPLSEVALRTGLDHPISGIGYYDFASQNPWAVDAHNAYLNVFAELGIPGLGLFTLILFLPLARYATIGTSLPWCSASGRDRVLYLQGLGILLTLTLSSLTNTFYESIYFWIAYIFSLLHLGWFETIHIPHGAASGSAEAR